MHTIDRDELTRMMDEADLTLVDVLDARHYQAFHLPGAVNVPSSARPTRILRKPFPTRLLRPRSIASTRTATPPPRPCAMVELR